MTATNNTHMDAQDTYAAYPLVSKAHWRASELLGQKHDSRLVFHNYAFWQGLMGHTLRLAQGEAADTATVEVALLAACFLPLGRLYAYELYVPHSEATAARELAALGCADDMAGRVLGCIRVVGKEQRPQTPEAAILHDALVAATYGAAYAERHALLRLEREFMLKQAYDRPAWAELQLQELMLQQLCTHSGRVATEELLARNILLQKLQAEKWARSEDPVADDAPAAALRPFEALEEAQAPLRTMQTFFRTNYRNHINLSAIADNKANIMISVNSILISVLITGLSYRNLAETNPMILLPVVVFLVTGLASLIFAVLSARPKVTALNRPGTPTEAARRNIVFFGNFVTLDLDQYEAATDAMLRDGELLLGNMTRDLYYLGQVLDKKYRYLIISYNIFMVGFITTVGLFLFALFG